MAHPGKIERWNRLYDEAPEDMRFQLLVWGLVAVGALNMLLTIWFGFPFGLLLVAAIAAVALVRVAPRLGVVWPEAQQEAPGWTAPNGPQITFTSAPSPMAGAFPRINTWLDSLPEFQRLGLYLAILALAGAVNILLSISGAFPFALLFLIAFVGLALVRGPWVFARTRAQYDEHRASRRRQPTALLPHPDQDARRQRPAGEAGAVSSAPPGTRGSDDAAMPTTP